MRPVRSDVGKLLLGAALAGALYAGLEAALVLYGGMLWVEQPLLLFVSGVLGGGLVWGGLGAVVARSIGLSFSSGVLGAALVIGGLELGLLILTDPPPYQEAQWWVNNPVAAVLAMAWAPAVVWLARRKAWTAWGWSALILVGTPLMKRDVSVSAADVLSNTNQPNVLLVTLDTARGDHVGAVGYSRDTTPFFDAMSGEGVRFDAAYAQVPVTGPSHLTLLTGYGPWTHGALLNGMSAPLDMPLLAERLAESGYRTAAFVSAFVLDGGLGFSRGFGIYDDDFSRLHGASGFLSFRVAAALTRRFVDHHVVERTGDKTVDLALSWLATQEGERPWFLWVHLFDPHGPYTPPPPFDNLFYTGDPRDPNSTSMGAVQNVAPYLKEHLEGITDLDWVVGQYDGEVAFADAQLGRLLGALEARKEVDDTVVIVAGDHGESLGEHGVWFNHGGDLYGASSRVPLAMRWPGEIPQGFVVKDPVELTDVAPTLYGLLGMVSVGEGEELSAFWQEGEGRSWVRSIGLDRAANRRARELEPGVPPKWRSVALRSRNELYVYRESGENELWAVSTGQDGSELETRLTDFDPVLEAELKTRALGLLEAGEQGAPRLREPLSDEARQRLEALGYVE